MRATKKNKGTGKKTATNGLSGVSHDEHGPVIEETLTKDQREIRMEAYFSLEAQIKALDADRAAKNAVFKENRRKLVEDQEALFESVHTNTAKSSAQQALPGTEVQ